MHRDRVGGSVGERVVDRVGDRAQRVEDPLDQQRHHEQRDRGERRPSPAKAIGWAFAALLLAAAGLLLQPWSGYRGHAGAATLRHAEFDGARDVARARAELELYARRLDRYPESLSDLAHQGLTDPDRLQSVHQAWVYTPDEDRQGFQLRPRSSAP